jgi:CDGSH-type Zn-finger protein
VVEQAGATLARLSGSLAAFLPPSAAHAPAAPGADPAGATAPADADLPALQARADSFYRRLVSDSSGPVPGDLARAIDEAWTVTTRLLQPGPGTRELRWLAPRLVDSVLRPLSDALQTLTPTTPATPSTPPDSVTPADQVWLLAQDVTRLRVQAHHDAEARAAEPGLAEATAALQGLACALAPAAGRGAILRDLQAELPAGIQVADNGPYLATNVASVRDHLGQEVPVPPQVGPPQLALCRCGASARKPFCDGTHASNGFTGDKDPTRVPYHRDTYDGEQVTVFDNRGVCQHSGFCTDRLNTVFRTDAEPFVAPSGGRMDEIVRAVRDCPSGALGLAFDGHEQRALADWHGRRYQAVEITRDGPYRITGGLALTGPDGAAVPQGEGASREHYALCRCGHSQNKPFCSGMHWYVGFRDPQLTPGRVPSLFEWAGGLPALTRLTRRLYEKLIPADPGLAPVFANLPPGYPEREARRIGAAFGGPADARAWVPAVTGDLPADQQARWVTLAGQAAGEVGLPADAPFRAALSAFLTWYAGAPLTSPDGAGQDGAGQDGGLPPWGWTAAGPPDTTAQPDAGDAGDVGQPVTLPGPDEPVSFASHVKPMFRAEDRQSMLFAFDLWSYDDVRTHAADVLERVANGTMPCDGAWPSQQVQAFRRWTETGTPA